MNFGLTGNPLGHSLSKVIHSELFKLKNVDFTYELLPTDNLEKLFSDQLSNLDGFNITIPYKTDIISFLNAVDDKVKLYNACNTVVNRDGVFTGYNTDVYGFLNTLKNCNITLENKRILGGQRCILQLRITVITAITTACFCLICPQDTVRLTLSSNISTKHRWMSLIAKGDFSL